MGHTARFSDVSMNKIFTKIIVLVLGAALALPLVSQAQGFNQNNIISDEFLTTIDKMSLTEVQSFLETQRGILAGYRTRDINGADKRAAEIIFEAGQQFRVNPRFLLSLLEKEQGLLSNPNPSAKALAWATGFGSYGSSKYHGFGAQVYYAAKAMGRDYDLYADYYRGFPVGRETVTEDGEIVRPENNATRKCYIYNPLVGGPGKAWGANWLLWHLINVKFATLFASYDGSGSDSRNHVAADFAAGKYFYREGTAVKVAGGRATYLIKDGRRHYFSGPNALRLRYNPSEVVTISLEEFSSYPDGGPTGLPDGIAVQRQKGGAVYIVADGKLHGVPNSTVLRQLGYHPSQIVKVTDSEINNQPQGEAIPAKNLTRPNGQLVKIAGQNTLFVYRDHKLYPLWDSQVRKVNFPHHPIILISSAEANNYQIMKTRPVLFRDGTLLMSTDGSRARAVFVVSRGDRYIFNSRDAFDDNGYLMKNVTKVSNRILQMHREGTRRIEQ